MQMLQLAAITKVVERDNPCLPSTIPQSHPKRRPIQTKGILPPMLLAVQLKNPIAQEANFRHSGSIQVLTPLNL